MSQHQYANNPSSTLSGALTAVDTSLSVTSATGFPSQGKFTIIVDAEIMLVTGVAGTVWTVTRGHDGTAAAAHNNNATVTQIITVDSFLNADHYDVRAYGAKGDGVTDDVTAIQAALTAATDAGGGTVYLPPGSYITSAVLNIGANTVVCGAGPASKITQATADAPVLQANSVNKVSVRDLWLVGGNNSARTDNRGVHFNTVTDGLIQRVRVETCYKSISVFSSNNITVEGCYVANDVTTSSSVGGAIDLNGCTRSIARGNRVDTPALHGIDAHNLGSDSMIDGNHVWNAGSTALVVSGHATSGTMEGCSVTNNVVRDSSYGIIVENGAQFSRVIGNFIEGMTNEAILVGQGTGDAPSGTVVEGNVIRSPGGHGIHVLSAVNTTVAANRISNPADRGIRCNGGTGNVLSNNIITDGATGIDILGGQEGTVVSGNLVRGMTGIGINVDAAHTLLSGNTVIDADNDNTGALAGIVLTGLADRSSVVGNQSYATGATQQDYGIIIQAGCVSAVVVGNQFAVNGVAGVSDSGTTTTLANNVTS